MNEKWFIHPSILNGQLFPEQNEFLVTRTFHILPWPKYPNVDSLIILEKGFYFSFLNLMHIFRAIVVIMIFEILLVYLNSVPVYIPCAQYLVTRMNDDSIVSMQGKV